MWMSWLKYIVSIPCSGVLMQAGCSELPRQILIKWNWIIICAFRIPENLVRCSDTKIYLSWQHVSKPTNGSTLGSAPRPFCYSRHVPLHTWCLCPAKCTLIRKIPILASHTHHHVMFASSNSLAGSSQQLNSLNTILLIYHEYFEDPSGVFRISQRVST